MGGTSWDTDHYYARSEARLSTGTPTFDYDTKVKTGSAPKAAHVTLDPKKIKNFKRECRDSETHPTSKPIYIGLDVTGSMSEVPKAVQKQLP